MSYYDERCGLGTQWGCKRYIGDGEQGHVVKHARSVGGVGSGVGSASRSSHVLFHPECCPCVVDPESVQPVGTLAQAAS